MKTRFSTIDLRAVLAELNARYCTAGDQAHAESAGDRGRGPTVQNRTSRMFSLYSALCHSSVDPVRPGGGERITSFCGLQATWGKSQHPRAPPHALASCLSRQVSCSVMAWPSLCPRGSPGSSSKPLVKHETPGGSQDATLVICSSRGFQTGGLVSLTLLLAPKRRSISVLAEGNRFGLRYGF